MYWITDSNSKYYNQLICINSNIKKDWISAEHLSDYKTEYSYGVEIKYNDKNEKEKGSAIFLHVSNGKPTAGCISIPEIYIIEIIKNIDKNTLVCII